MKDMRPETPFPKHWFYYIVLKMIVLAGALIAGTKVAGWW